MIHFTTGNILEAKTEVIVIPVNTVGVMGKGLALDAKNKYPEMYKFYRKICLDKSFVIGKIGLHFADNLQIFLFPTKKHWKNPSQIEYIEVGLKALNSAIQDFMIKSIAIPKLGCGLGGLDWNEVKLLIVKALKDVECEIYIYEN